MITYLFFHLLFATLFHINHLALGGPRFTYGELILTVTLAPIVYAFQLYTFLYLIYRKITS